jgi:hypothetical protein
MLCISLSLKSLLLFPSVRLAFVSSILHGYVKNCIIRTENDRHTENSKQLYKLHILFASVNSLASASKNHFKNISGSNGKLAC